MISAPSGMDAREAAIAREMANLPRSEPLPEGERARHYRQAASGDPESMAALAFHCIALAQSGAMLASEAFAATEVMFGLAAIHGRPDDLGRLSLVRSIRSGFMRRLGIEHADVIDADAMMLAGQAADRDPSLYSLFEGLVATAEPSALAIARKLESL